MNKVTDVSIETIQGPSGVRIATALIETLGRTSGAEVTETSIEYATRILEPSVNSACYYFGVKSFSARELFEQEGASSLMELVNREKQQNG
ncbi:hypothetical protein [Vibrio sp. OPT18]|uniref:hypothetical protein n=1 Tax=Vibrio sp. OPT18 TaxID=2778641 RepID=UPI0018828EA3|nr:hypothetical protein [Vibrio sp. OPT18]MBE8578679.1 hypothetical protein [Vibrio sp. OPT18]